MQDFRQIGIAENRSGNRPAVIDHKAPPDAICSQSGIAAIGRLNGTADTVPFSDGIQRG